MEMTKFDLSVIWSMSDTDMTHIKIKFTWLTSSVDPQNQSVLKFIQ
jgi:hypothetical protein